MPDAPSDAAPRAPTPMAIPTIDTHDFSRRGDTASGRVPVPGLDRLAGMLVEPDGCLEWRLTGRSHVRPDGSRQSFLKLELGATLRMRCVRCLEPVAVELAVARDYRLVATEAQAEVEDVDEDDFDVLVSARRFDLAGLIEDEAIMALPLAPRHDDCRPPAVPEAPSVPESDAAPAATAFAALAALRRGGAGDDGA
jgi:uncharacterized protein